jgi:hypothetical protein
MWNKLFSGKKDQVVKEISPEAEEALKAQDAPRTEPLNGTETEIEKQAQDGMKTMGFKPVEEKNTKMRGVAPVESNALIKDYEKQEQEELDKLGRFKPRIRGNDYCPCGSNKKFKKCCCLDEKKVGHLERKYDIRLATAETIRKLKNEANRKKKKEVKAKIVEVKTMAKNEVKI